MKVESTSPINYYLALNEEKILLNAYLGQTLKLQFLRQIHCMGCHRPIKKSYQDGYCFPCVQTLAQCDLCILKPERCHYHLNTCREPQWGQTHCMVPHIVYLANTSDLKVGITRKTQLPIRWIDQGAIAAIPLFEVSTRRISGLVESLIAQRISDKTNWRRMLKGETQDINLKDSVLKITEQLDDLFLPLYQQFGEQAIQFISDPEVNYFQYPILEHPQKIVSLSFDKTELIEGTLLGMKGQYLIFDKGVINIRKYSGYQIAVKE